MRQVLGTIAGLVILVAFTALQVQSWSEAAAVAFSSGAFTLVMALPKLRKDEEADRALMASVCALGLLVGAAAIAVYVIHSWAWLGFALTLIVVLGLLEAWEQLEAQREPSAGSIEEDMAEKLHRQDEQLEKTYRTL